MTAAVRAPDALCLNSIEQSPIEGSLVGQPLGPIYHGLVHIGQVVKDSGAHGTVNIHPRSRRANKRRTNKRPGTAFSGGSGVSVVRFSPARQRRAGAFSRIESVLFANQRDLRRVDDLFDRHARSGYHDLRPASIAHTGAVVVRRDLKPDALGRE